jgi:Xaa-Pro aminopeptidase
MLSLSERDRRYAAVRKEMAARDVDVLLIVGRDGSGARGAHRYLSGYGIVAAFSHYIVFPVEDVEPVFFSGSSPAANIGVASGWVNDLRPSRKPLDEIAAEVGRYKASGKIGVSDTLPLSLHRALAMAHGEDSIVEALDCLRGPRIRKSPEEIDCVRRSAKVADRTFELVQKVVRPGVSDFEIYAEARRVIHSCGCEYSMDIIDVGDGTAAGAPQGRRVASDGIAQLELTPALEGYYTQLRVPFSSRENGWPDQWARLLGAWEEGYRSAAELIVPGTPAREIQAAALAGVEHAGLTGRRRAGHGLGLEVDEFISISEDDDTVLESGMVVVLHVPVLTDDLMLMTGGTFIVTETGHDELNNLSSLMLSTMGVS